MSEAAGTLLDRLRAELGAAVRTDRETLAAHSRDAWVLSELADLEGAPAHPPLAVLEPTSVEQVSAALALCNEAHAPVVPFGGGSGVCGGIRTEAESIVLATRGLDGLISLDGENRVARFRAGTNGMEAERLVAAEGFTIGHWPQSIEQSTVGGWIATRASGQFSTAYGSIEDLVLGLEVVLADGSVLRTGQGPRASTGPDLRHLFLGSEGTLGVVTEVGLSLRGRPAAQARAAFHFAGFGEGLEAIRRLVQAGFAPPVARLYDARESRRHFRDWCPKGRHALLLLHEGPEAAVEAERAGVDRLCLDAGGARLDAAVVDHWLETRNRVPGFRGFLEQGIILDTIEVACSWSNAAPLYDRVTTALEKVPDLLGATGHSSHSYRSGTCLYFTFAARPAERSAMAPTYRECWKRTLEATRELGGTISHHHGIGRVRREALAGELGGTGLRVLRSLKDALDPNGILNPGALFPDA